MLTLDAIAGTLVRDEQRRQFQTRPETPRQAAPRRWLRALKSGVGAEKTVGGAVLALEDPAVPPSDAVRSSAG